ncbi:response regulator [Candidatus Marsarchaeota archaeon]|nr:response regulator [Candidatus Marsarchaeota archaeon]
MVDNKKLDADSDAVIAIIKEKQQIARNELSSLNINEQKLDRILTDLEAIKLISSRNSGGVLTYYSLEEQNSLRKVLIVEDDKNINRLMLLSVGKGFEINQIYDGEEAIKFIRTNKPDLVILDLMLPHKDGLDICQTVKTDPETKNTIIIIISAMDPTSNRFKGIKYGADYYIKKPFDPNELRTLVTLFLKKKGKKFDPLIDLPDEERISNEIEQLIKIEQNYKIGILEIQNLRSYIEKFSEKSAMVVLRLISQLLQDIIKQYQEHTFVGFLNSNAFVIGATKDNIEKIINDIKKEFNAVLPFILQDEGYKLIELNLESMFESNEIPKLYLIFKEISKEKLIKKREEILKYKPKSNIGSYSYEELQQLFGNENLDIKITRNNDEVNIHVGKLNEEE